MKLYLNVSAVLAEYPGHDMNDLRDILENEGAIIDGQVINGITYMLIDGLTIDNVIEIMSKHGIDELENEEFLSTQNPEITNNQLHENALANVSQTLYLDISVNADFEYRSLLSAIMAEDGEIYLEETNSKRECYQIEGLSKDQLVEILDNEGIDKNCYVITEEKPDLKKSATTHVESDENVVQNLYLEFDESKHYLENDTYDTLSKHIQDAGGNMSYAAGSFYKNSNICFKIVGLTKAALHKILDDFNLDDGYCSIYTEQSPNIVNMLSAPAPFQGFTYTRMAGSSSRNEELGFDGDDYSEYYNGPTIKIIMTGSPKKCTGDALKAYWLAAHGKLEETTSWKEAKILFTDDLNSTSSKMQKAKKLGIEIRTYDNAEEFLCLNEDNCPLYEDWADDYLAVQAGIDDYEGPDGDPTVEGYLRGLQSILNMDNNGKKIFNHCLEYFAAELVDYDYPVKITGTLKDLLEKRLKYSAQYEINRLTKKDEDDEEQDNVNEGLIPWNATKEQFHKANLIVLYDHIQCNDVFLIKNPSKEEIEKIAKSRLEYLNKVFYFVNLDNLIELDYDDEDQGLQEYFYSFNDFLKEVYERASRKLENYKQVKGKLGWTEVVDSVTTDFCERHEKAIKNFLDNEDSLIRRYYTVDNNLKDADYNYEEIKKSLKSFESFKEKIKEIYKNSECNGDSFWSSNFIDLSKEKKILGSNKTKIHFIKTFDEYIKEMKKLYEKEHLGELHDIIIPEEFKNK